jgi:nicotinamide phosphoribosyltransferase
MDWHPIFDTDSYKLSHFLQYPPGTTGMVDYLESRGGKYPTTLFFGLRYLLENYLSQPVNLYEVLHAAKIAKLHGVPFNREGWEYIVLERGGKLPVEIYAVDEGSVVPTGNILMRIQSTDPKAFWIVGWLETMLMRVWYPTTVATQSYYIKQDIKKWLEATADSLDGLPFKLHDFGSRGVSSQESAAIGGAAHLVNFKGSDTMAALMFLYYWYGEEMAGFSIPAAEHSTITAWGKEHEVDAYRNMLTQFAKPGSLVAVVSDSYDLWNAIDNMWGGSLKQQVIDSGATVIIRPDSGDPASVIRTAIRKLGEKFGYTINSKGYRVLNHVRLIQGDGVNQESINDILHTVTYDGYSADNLAFGMGGALLQQVNRDTQKFAIKCCGICKTEGTSTVFVPVFKDPATDPGKRSKSGFLDLEYNPESGYRTVEGRSWQSVLRLAFRDGEIDPFYASNNNLRQIRERAK